MTCCLDGCVRSGDPLCEEHLLRLATEPDWQPTVERNTHIFCSLCGTEVVWYAHATTGTVYALEAEKHPDGRCFPGPDGFTVVAGKELAWRRAACRGGLWRTHPPNCQQRTDLIGDRDAVG